jgi:hypothetical protein
MHPMASTTSPGDAKPASPGVKDAQASSRRRADLAFAACAHSRSRADQTSMGASCALGPTPTPTLLGPVRKKSWGDVPTAHPGADHFSLKGPPHRGASTHPLSSRLPAKAGRVETVMEERAGRTHIWQPTPAEDVADREW